MQTKVNYKSVKLTFLDVVVRKSSTILELFTSKDQSLLIWGNALLVLDFGFNIIDGVWSFDLQSDGLASQSLDEDLHLEKQTTEEYEQVVNLRRQE